MRSLRGMRQTFGAPWRSIIRSLAGCSPGDAHLQLQQPGAGAWLQARSAEALGLSLEPVFFRVLRMRLRLPVPHSRGYCPFCDGVADCVGDHVQARCCRPALLSLAPARPAPALPVAAGLRTSCPIQGCTALWSLTSQSQAAGLHNGADGARACADYFLLSAGSRAFSLSLKIAEAVIKPFPELRFLARGPCWRFRRVCH